MESRTYPLVYPPPAPAPKKIKKVRPWRPKGPFRFFDLPSEIRNRIYEFSLLVPRTVDLEPQNHGDVASKLALLQTCRRMHEEAYPIFYGRHTFRLFPTHAQFFHTKRVLLARLPTRYRSAITSVELRLGPGWSKPPKTWNMGPQLGLADCTALRRLKFFVEIDPSHDIFKGFRLADSATFYTLFSANLFEELMDQVPSLQEVIFEAYPSVRKDSVLIQELVAQAEAENKRITWSGNSWDEKPNATECEVLELRLAHLSISNHLPQMVI